jgi:hypothetical protein
VVPNDNSYLQKEIVRQGFAKPDYWISDPEHQSYFNAESFRNVLEHSGFQIQSMLGDFPIDLFLFNPDSNYMLDGSKGKKCHFARVMVGNTIASQSIEKLIAFREGCAKAGIGRDLIAYCKI